MKRALIIILVILVAAGVILTGYYLRPKQNISVQTGGDTSSAGLPDAAQNINTQNNQNQGANATLVSAENLKIDNYFVNTSGTITAITTRGRVVSINNEGSQIAEISPELPNYSKSTFSPDGTKAALAIGGDKESYNILDIKKKAWTSVPAEYQNLTFSPDSTQIAALIYSDKGTSLITTDLSFKNRVTQTTLNDADILIKWASPTIFIADRASGLSTGSFIAFSPKNRSLSMIAEDSYGIEFITRPDGKALLFKGDDSSKRGGKLYLLNSTYSPEKEFGLLTLPSKCAFGDIKANRLFCAIPKDSNSFKSEILPDSYYNRSIITSDNFYNIDLATGEMSKLDGPDSIDAIKLQVSGNRIYFIDRTTSKLDYINI